MQAVIVLLFFASLISLVIGLIVPNKFSKIFRNKTITRKFILQVFGTATVVLFFSIGIFATPEQKAETSLRRQQNQQKTEDVQVQNTPVEGMTSSSEPVLDFTVTTTLEDSPSSTAFSSPIATTSTSNSETENSDSSTVPLQNTSDSLPESVFYTVVSVVDGDTIKINVDGKTETFRLIGMDTPETVDPRKPVQCFGQESSNKAKELLSGKKVKIETDLTQGDLDKYNRHLAYIYLEDGLFFNKYMIEQGYAHEYTYNTPYKYQAEFKLAQKSAQENQRGLWSSDTCNGDTVSSAPTEDTAVVPSASGQYYTSSYHTAKYYYPADCSGWESLSPKYLKAFNSLEALLKAFPSRSLSPQC